VVHGLWEKALHDPLGIEEVKRNELRGQDEVQKTLYQGRDKTQSCFLKGAPSLLLATHLES